MSEDAPHAGETIAPLTLATTRGPITVPDADGRPTLLLFYVEAGTPLCVRQLGAFEQDAELLDEARAVVIAISVDPPERQQAFAITLGCQALALAGDPAGDLARRFGIYDEHERRARRAAFVIDGSGTIRAAQPWYNPANSDQYAALFAALLPATEEDNG